MSHDLDTLLRYVTCASTTPYSTVLSEKLSSLRHPPPILGAFYNNENNFLFIVIEQAISQ